MKRYVRLLMIFLAASGAYAEAALSGSATGTMDLPGPEGGGEIGLGVSADWYRPFSGEVALLADVVADVRFLPAISLLSGSAGLSCDASMARAAFLARLRVEALGETSASLTAFAGLAAAGEAAAALLLSWGGLVASAQVEPAVRLAAGERTLWGPSVRLGVSGALGSQLLVSAEAEGSMDLPTEGGAEPGWAAGARVEWLPGAPFTLRVDFDIERRLSDAVATIDVGGGSLEVPGYWGYLLVSGGTRASMIVVPRVDVSVDVRCSYRRSDHGIIEGAAVLAEKEWSLQIEPTLLAGIDLSRRLSLGSSCADLISLSNAAPSAHLLSASVEMTLLLY